ncbi:MAG: type III secretion protein [Zoogloeaceae bacterium]|jgi:hypothetical protein|nr:type III secretion protein [Zoogloeaceae bacterium]
MAKAYSLAGLLFIREFRVDAAAKAVSVAEALLRDAEAAHSRRQEEHATYRKWRGEETERRYFGIMEQNLSLDELDQFKIELAMLVHEELQKEAAVRDAAHALAAAREKVAVARTSWREADRERQKILYHRDEWQKESVRAEAHQEDLEMEEFKPVLFVAEAEVEE